MTTTRTVTIELPRLPGESNRAYAARVEYVTMGAGRSIERAARNNTKTIPHYKVWSAKYNWVDHARAYDDQIAYLTIQERAAAYKADLEAHRQEAMAYGKSLCGVAMEMLAELRNARKSLDYSPAALATVARALTTGMDLRAHSLQLDALIPRLTGDDHE